MDFQVSSVRIPATSFPEAEKKGLGIFGLLAAAMGSLAGVAWMTIIGSWLVDPGPVAAMLGFALAGVLMLGLAGSMSELTGMMPLSGGPIVYANEVYGRSAALMVGWFLLFECVTTLSYEAVSLGWVLDSLFPIIRFPALFHFLGADVTLTQLIGGQAAIWTVYLINRRGLQTTARTQEVLTVIKFLIVIGFVLGGVFLGRPSRAFSLPSGTTVKVELWKVLSFATAGTYWLTSFTYISRLAGDRSSKVSARTLGMLTLALVGLAVGFYFAVIIASAAAAPIQDTARSRFPAAFAANAIFGNPWAGRFMLVAAGIAILSLMNVVLLAGSRLLRASRALANSENSTDECGAQRNSDDFILLVTAGAIGAIAGRGMLVPLCNTGALALMISYFFMCHATLKLRRTEPNRSRPFMLPFGEPLLVTIIICMGLTVLFLLLQPLWTMHRRFPIEWVIVGAWATIGGLLWGQIVRRHPAPPHQPQVEAIARSQEGQSVIVGTEGQFKTRQGSTPKRRLYSQDTREGE